MKKVMLVFGTRPEAIKMCPIILELRKKTEIETVVCITGQHKEMLEQVIALFKIDVKYDLQIMKKNQNLFDITTSVMNGLREILIQEKPDIVLVHGDTTTTFAASLSCFYLQIPIGHVEAGLRTYNLKSPYPEEFNRQAAGIIAQYHFAPTKQAKENLMREGKQESSIYVCGNTVIDALKTTVSREYYHKELEWAAGSKMVLMTAHRRENLGKPMEQIFRAVRRIVEENPDTKLIYPVHKNPIVRELADKLLGGNKRIHLIEPLDVFDFHNFMDRSFLILTDSGGIQEEAPALGKPVLVLRDTTERPEGIQAGTLKLVGTQYDNVCREFQRLLDDRTEYKRMSQAVNPYGDGHASERIVEVLRCR